MAFPTLCLQIALQHNVHDKMTKLRFAGGTISAWGPIPFWCRNGAISSLNCVQCNPFSLFSWMVDEQDANQWHDFALHCGTFSSCCAVKSNAFCALHFHMARCLRAEHCTTLRCGDCFTPHPKVGGTKSTPYASDVLGSECFLWDLISMDSHCCWARHTYQVITGRSHE